MRTNKWFIISLIAVLSMILAACGGAATPTQAPAAPTAAPAAPAEPTKAPEPTAVPVEPTKAPEPAAAGKPLIIGEMTDNSGGLAIYGPLFERGFEIGLDYVTDGTRTIAGRPIQLVLKDTASNTEKGATLAREAIEKDGAEILLGVPSSPTALAVGGIAAQNKKVYIAGPAASDAITGANFNPYVFRCGRQNTQDALTMGAALTKLGENFIQISQDNAFGQGSAASFYKVVKAAGGTFPINDTEKGVGTIFAPPDTTDFTPYINQILDSKADALIVTWSGAGFVPMFQQMTQMGVFDQMDVATGMGDNQTLAKGYADAVNSVGVSVYHYSLFDTPENKYLTDEHIKRFTVPPDLWAEAGFNCAVMVKQALEATKGDTDGDKLIAALEGMKFKGPKGNYEVRASDHALLQPMTLVKLTNTTDPAFKFFDLVTLFQPEETAPPCAVPAEQGRCK
jgi:branched-chain amino acid transport system substrate-binding protein